MNTSLPVHTNVGQCPPWCSGGHLPSADGLVHISVDQVTVAASGPESHEVYVSIEQVERAGEWPPASVRLEGASSAPMTPAQAMQLAAVLQTAAFAASSGMQVTA